MEKSMGYKKKLNSECKWCRECFNMEDKPKGFMANHSRWCVKNPNKDDYMKTLSKNRESITEESRKLAGKAVSKAWENGSYSHVKFNTFQGKTHTEEAREKIRKAQLSLTYRRLRKGVIEYKGIKLDSSWELELAKRLDELQIKWIRPEPIKWVDKNGHERNYFPDFYLEDYDLYLDPKNPAAYQNQIEKIEILKKVIPNLKFILSLKECKEFNI
jgi:hypothetical protein